MEQITRKGAYESPKVINPLVWLKCNDCCYDPNWRPTGEEVADIFRISQRNIGRVQRRFVEDGLEYALGGR